MRDNIYERYPVGTIYYDAGVKMDPNKFMPNSKWKLLYVFGPTDRTDSGLQKIYQRIA